MATRQVQPALICPLCSLTSHLKLNVTTFLKHIKLFHAHQAGFKITCGIHGCQRTFTNFRTFENHVSAMHRSNCDLSSIEVENTTSEDTESQSSSHLLDADLSEYEDSDEDLEVSNDPVPSVSDDHEAIQYSSELFQKSAALFLLGLKEKHKLSQVALQGVLEGVTNLNQ